MPANTAAGSGIMARISRRTASAGPSRSTAEAKDSPNPSPWPPRPARTARPVGPFPSALAFTMRAPPEPVGAVMPLEGIFSMCPPGTAGVARTAKVPMGSVASTVFSTPSGAPPSGSAMRTESASGRSPAGPSRSIAATEIPSAHAPCQPASPDREMPLADPVAATSKPFRSVKEISVSPGEAAICRRRKDSASRDRSAAPAIRGQARRSLAQASPNRCEGRAISAALAASTTAGVEAHVLASAMRTTRIASIRRAASVAGAASSMRAMS